MNVESTHRRLNGGNQEYMQMTIQQTDCGELTEYISIEVLGHKNMAPHNHHAANRRTKLATTLITICIRTASSRPPKSRVYAIVYILPCHALLHADSTRL